MANEFLVKNGLLSPTVKSSIVKSPLMVQGAWSVGNSMPSNASFGGAAGGQSDALSFGGQSPANSTATQEYNGSTWSGGGTLTAGRCCLSGTGTQNAALALGGSTGNSVSCAEEYDGSSWSSTTALLTERQQLSSVGSVNSAVVVGGYGLSGDTGIDINIGPQSTFDGTTWTDGAVIPTKRFQAGISNDGNPDSYLIFGGRQGYLNYTNMLIDGVSHEWDGSTFSAKPALLSPRLYVVSAGTSNNALAAGGYGCRINYMSPDLVKRKHGRKFASDFAASCTENYNGITWNMGSPLIEYNGFKCGANGGGSSTAALAFGGNSGEGYKCFMNGNPGYCMQPVYPTAYNRTFIYDSHIIPLKEVGGGNLGYNLGGGIKFINAIQGLSWNIVSSLNVMRISGASVGTQQAQLALGGYDTGFDNICCAEEYDGVSWANITGMPSPAGCGAAVGTTTSALQISGYDQNEPSFYLQQTMCWDGSSWSYNPGLVQPDTGGAAGTPSAALSLGSDYSNNVETWDGAAWAVVSPFSFGEYGVKGAGTQNAALALLSGDVDEHTCLESWNGTSWSVEQGQNVGRRDGNALGGSTNDATLTAGYINYTNSGYSGTERYDGTTWSTSAVLAMTAYQGFGCAPSNNGTGMTYLTGNGLGVNAMDNNAYIPTVQQLNPYSIQTTLEYNSCTGTLEGNITGSFSGEITGSLTGSALLDTFRSPIIPLPLGTFSAGPSNTFTGTAYAAGNPCAALIAYCTSANTFDGTSFSATTAMNTSRFGGGVTGTQNDAIIVGGFYCCLCAETFDGTSWTNITNSPTIRCFQPMVGTTNNAIDFGGGSGCRCTISWDGTSWSYKAALNNSQVYRTGFGDSTTCILATGGGNSNAYELYDGLTWRSYTYMITQTSCNSGTGTVTGGGITFGGADNRNEAMCTTLWIGDSTMTSTSGSLILSRICQSNPVAWVTGPPMLYKSLWSSNTVGSVNDAALFQSVCSNYPASTLGCNSPGCFTQFYSNGVYNHKYRWINEDQMSLDATGSFNIASDISFKSVSNSVTQFTIAPEPLVPRAWADVVGNSTGFLIAGGISYANLGCQCTNLGNTSGGVIVANISDSIFVTEEYEAPCTDMNFGISSYSTKAPMTIGRKCGGVMVGSPQAAVYFGGCSFTGTYNYYNSLTSCGLNITEEYDGSVWSIGNNRNNTTYQCLQGLGTQNAAFSIGMCNYTATVCTELYDGSTWSYGPAYSGCSPASLLGNQSSAILAGGLSGNAGNRQTCITSCWDGSSYSSGPNLPVYHYGGSGFGTTNDGRITGGFEGCSGFYPLQKTIDYDGTNWSLGINTLNPSGYNTVSARGTSTNGVLYTNRAASYCCCSICNIGTMDCYTYRVMGAISGYSYCWWPNIQLLTTGLGTCTTMAFDRMKGVLSMNPQHPLPTNVATGSFAVSGSVPKPYFFDGSAWCALY